MIPVQQNLHLRLVAVLVLICYNCLRAFKKAQFEIVPKFHAKILSAKPEKP